MKHVTRMSHHRHTGRHEVMHWLYNPAALGRMSYRVRLALLHKIHLIPGCLMRWSCDRYDRRLGLSEDEIQRKGPTS
jgi:hypothetical protein